MEERILVPLDGSEIGEAVLPKLEDLVLRTTPQIDAEVTLLQVIPQKGFVDAPPSSENELTELTQKSQDYLEKVAGGLREKGFNVKTLVTIGYPAEEIVQAARSINAHLIAMSTYARSGIVRWAIGSVTDKVIRLEGKIPVLAVRAGKQEENPVITMGSLQSMVKHS